MLKKVLVGLILTFALMLSEFTVSAAVAGVDNTIYNFLLKKHVVNGRVDYDNLKKDETLLDQYLAILSSTDIDALSEQARFAFYINAYNAFTLKLVLTRYPGIDSIKEIGGFFSSPWKIEFIALQNKKVTLDHIEHDILRPIYKDPRVHFAVNCASKSCPPLRAQAYETDRINEQLNEQTRLFINGRDNYTLKGNTLYINKIFKWFKQDFNNNPIEFFKTYADPPLKQKLDALGPDIKIKYLDYDWSLNR